MRVLSLGSRVLLGFGVRIRFTNVQSIYCASNWRASNHYYCTLKYKLQCFTRPTTGDRPAEKSPPHYSHGSQLPRLLIQYFRSCNTGPSGKDPKATRWANWRWEKQRFPNILLYKRLSLCRNGLGKYAQLGMQGPSIGGKRCLVEGLLAIYIAHFTITAMMMRTGSELFQKSSLLLLVTMGFCNKISRKRQDTNWYCHWRSLDH